MYLIKFQTNQIWVYLTNTLGDVNEITPKNSILL